MTQNQPEFPNYFDPDREAKAAAAEEADAARTGRAPSHPVDPDVDPDLAAMGNPAGVKDGMIDVDAYGNPTDPTDPDLEDLAQASGPQFSGFPFPGVGGRTRGGMEWRVGGCCLPIPLLMGVAGLAATLAAGRRRRP